MSMMMKKIRDSRNVIIGIKMTEEEAIASR